MICGHSFFKPSQTQNNQEIIAETQRYHFRWPSHHGEHHYYSFNLNYPLLTQQQPDDEIRPSHNKMHFPHDATHTEWSPPLAVSLSGLTGWWDSHEKMWNSPMDIIRYNSGHPKMLQYKFRLKGPRKFSMDNQTLLKMGSSTLHSSVRHHF